MALKRGERGKRDNDAAHAEIIDNNEYSAVRPGGRDKGARGARGVPLTFRTAR